MIKGMHTKCGLNVFSNEIYLYCFCWKYNHVLNQLLYLIHKFHQQNVNNSLCLSKQHKCKQSIATSVLSTGDCMLIYWSMCTIQLQQCG